jgi:hypothetical protein
MLQGFASLNIRMQRFFSDWSAAEYVVGSRCDYIDWLQCDYLRELNVRLASPCPQRELFDALSKGYDDLSRAADELIERASRSVPGLAEHRRPLPSSSDRSYYGYVYDKLGI